MLVAETLVPLGDPERIIPLVCSDLADHDALISLEGDTHVVTFPFGMGFLHIQPDGLALRVESDDLSNLYYLRMALASHVKEFASDPSPEIVWTGDGSDLVTPPNFRIGRVQSWHDITPHMRRITFSGEDLSRFTTDDNLHVSLIIPPRNTPPVWPTVGRDGMIKWHDGEGRPTLRRYTVRNHNLSKGEIEIDFVLHEDAGPGSDFAARVKTGDIIGISGPGGGGVRGDRDWYLLAGDETALPAIGRILETLPKTAKGLALIEVAGPAEQQSINNQTGIQVNWLHRDCRQDASTNLLADALRQVELPADGSSLFVWAGCEFDTFKSIRSYLRKERGLKKDQHLVVSYWRKGQSEDEALKSDDQEH